MASYNVPVTHANVLNTVFNNSDFNYSSLTNTTVSGNLSVSGVSTFNNSINVNGTANSYTSNCTGTSSCLNSTVNNNETIGGTLISTGQISANGGLSATTIASSGVDSGSKRKNKKRQNICYCGKKTNIRRTGMHFNR